MSDSPVSSLRLSPGYGPGETVVDWTRSSLMAQNGAIYVYRSDDNGHTWNVLNEADPVQSSSSYLDTTLPPAAKDVHVQYRVVGQLLDGSLLGSTPVAFYSDISREEYNVVGAMINREAVNMLHGGIRVWHSTPLRAGTPCGGFDEDTLQNIPDCEDDADCYGQNYKGGFTTPFATRLKFSSQPVRTEVKDTDTGVETKQEVEARMLAWPRPRTRDLIVLVDNDDRYAVSEVVDGHKFKNLVPVVWTVKLTLLERDDARYGFPVPEYPES